MKTYRGYRKMQLDLAGEPQTDQCIVTVETGHHKRALRPRLDIRNHSPTGFEWGYNGSGPAQLALALVADACGRGWADPVIYQRVKNYVVSRLPKDGWVLTEEQIQAVVAQAADEAGLFGP